MMPRCWMPTCAWCKAWGRSSSRRWAAPQCATSSSKIQPMLGLHGHIHESAAIRRLGRTIAINPGSDYSTGALHGALVTLKDGQGGRPPAGEGLAGGRDAGCRRRRHVRRASHGPHGRQASGSWKPAAAIRPTSSQPGLGGTGSARLAVRRHRGAGRPGAPARRPPPGGGHRPHRPMPVGLPGGCERQATRRRSDLPRQPGHRGGGHGSGTLRRCGHPWADGAPARGLPHRPQADVAEGPRAGRLRARQPRAAAARPGGPRADGGDCHGRYARRRDARPSTFAAARGRTICIEAMGLPQDLFPPVRPAAGPVGGLHPAVARRVGLDPGRPGHPGRSRFPGLRPGRRSRRGRSGQ